MAGYLSYLATEQENRMLLAEMRKGAALYTDEQWVYYLYSSLSKAAEKLVCEPSIHICIWDITSSGSLEILKKIRQKRKEPLLLIVAEESISPAAYLKPMLSPKALLLKPFRKEEIKETCQELFEEFESMYRSKEKAEGMFTAERREGMLILPLRMIDSFEARSKKIYVRTGRMEYGFYGTMEEVEQKLPESFVRCHRSFITNMDHVWEVDYGKQLLKLKNGTEIPFSRSHRKAIKEYWCGR